MTCCGVCSSLKGAAYFVTSVQIFIGLHLFLKWAVIPIIKIKAADLEYFDEDRQQIIYPLLLIYFTVFIVLGCINFLALQKEAGKVLQWTTRLLLILQILELGSHILLGFILPDEETEDADMSRAWHLQRFILSLTGSLVYFVILFKYSSALVNGTYPSRKEKSFEIEDRYYDPPKFPTDAEDKKLRDNKKNKKSNKKNKDIIPEDEDEGARLRVSSSGHSPSAPPPTPTPGEPSSSQNDDEELDGDGEPTYIDADEGEDDDFEGNVYVAGPDKRNLRI